RPSHSARAPGGTESFHDRRARRPARLQHGFRRGEPSWVPRPKRTTEGLWLRCVGRWLGFRGFFLLVIADHTFQGANSEDRTFLAAGDKSDGTQGHLISP